MFVCLVLRLSPKVHRASLERFTLVISLPVKVLVRTVVGILTRMVKSGSSRSRLAATEPTKDGLVLCHTLWLSSTTTSPVTADRQQHTFSRCTWTEHNRQPTKTTAVVQKWLRTNCWLVDNKLSGRTLLCNNRLQCIHVRHMTTFVSKEALTCPPGCFRYSLSAPS
eukprot:SAG31_NODE_12546_length_933_cov_17.425659_1_plen_166_part_00